MKDTKINLPCLLTPEMNSWHSLVMTRMHGARLNNFQCGKENLKYSLLQIMLGDNVKFEEAKLTSKGQITIPKSVRVQLGLKPGKSVLFIPEGREVTMIPKVKEPLKELEKIREEAPLFTEAEIKQMIKESKKEWSKVE